ncbi:MAG: hypothetical protein OHK0050_44560 [Roseiflexaceae bacterium]
MYRKIFAQFLRGLLDADDLRNYHPVVIAGRLPVLPADTRQIQSPPSDPPITPQTHPDLPVAPIAPDTHTVPARAARAR